MPKGTCSGSGEFCPLKISFQGGYWPSVCRMKTWGQKKTSEGGEVGMQTPSPRQGAISEGTNRTKEIANLLSKVVERDEERDPSWVRAQGSQVPLWPLPLSRGARGLSVEASTRGERRSSTSMLNPPPH